MSQRMEAWTSREEATAKMNMTRDEKRKLMMTPERISMALVKCRAAAMPITSAMLRQHPVKHRSTIPGPAIPQTMAMVAPSAPPPETPRV